MEVTLGHVKHVSAGTAECGDHGLELLGRHQRVPHLLELGLRDLQRERDRTHLGLEDEPPRLGVVDALVEPRAEISVERQPQYVSRGGTKLAYALESFGIDVLGLTVVDVGASTGGFTDAPRTIHL